MPEMILLLAQQFIRFICIEAATHSIKNTIFMTCYHSERYMAQLNLKTGMSNDGELLFYDASSYPQFRSLFKQWQPSTPYSSIATP
jgi:hypothetical protein